MQRRAWHLWAARSDSAVGRLSFAGFFIFVNQIQQIDCMQQTSSLSIRLSSYQLCHWQHRRARIFQLQALLRLWISAQLRNRSAGSCFDVESFRNMVEMAFKLSTVYAWTLLRPLPQDWKSIKGFFVGPLRRVQTLRRVFLLCNFFFSNSNSRQSLILGVYLADFLELIFVDVYAEVHLVLVSLYTVSLHLKRLHVRCKLRFITSILRASRVWLAWSISLHFCERILMQTLRRNFDKDFIRFFDIFWASWIIILYVGLVPFAKLWL